VKKSFKQRFRDWLNSHDDDQINKYPSTIGSIGAIISPSDPIDSHDGLTLTIHSANGGHVVNFRRYEHKIDRHTNKLYIISSDQKFEEALAQCIAMECLSR
jgi:hypothetical protein